MNLYKKYNYKRSLFLSFGLVLFLALSCTKQGQMSERTADQAKLASSGTSAVITTVTATNTQSSTSQASVTNTSSSTTSVSSTATSSNTSTSTATPSNTASGYNIQGTQTTCQLASSGLVCDKMFSPGDQFAVDCGKSGGTATMCACHTYLCSVKIPSGYDINGTQTSCPPPSPGLICDRMYSPGDQYAADCATAGGTATMCGCHSYLCSVKVH